MRCASRYYVAFANGGSVLSLAFRCVGSSEGFVFKACRICFWRGFGRLERNDCIVFYSNLCATLNNLAASKSSNIT